MTCTSVASSIVTHPGRLAVSGVQEDCSAVARNPGLVDAHHHGVLRGLMDSTMEKLMTALDGSGPSTYEQLRRSSTKYERFACTQIPPSCVQSSRASRA